MKNFEIPIFCLPPPPPWQAPPSSPVFSGHGPNIKIPLPRFFCLVVPISKRYDMTPLPPNPPPPQFYLKPPLSRSRPAPQTPGGDRFGRNPLFRGQGLTLRPGGSVTHPKITSKELSGLRKFWAGLSNESKVTALFCGDTRTDGHTKTNHFTTITNFFCIFVRGRRKTL